MSNLWLNVRLWSWHLQIGEPRWWSVRVVRNPMYIGSKSRFRVYTLRPWRW